jgi:small subunit ribosomal protein S2
MAYPVDEIYDQKLKSTSKKIAATRKQKWQRLEKYFGGVTKMSKMTKKQLSQNVGIIVGQKEELNAVYECQKLGIKMFTVVDTNCNPRLSDYIIPANDDSRNSIKFILGKMLTYMRLAQKLRQKILSRRIQKKVKTI